MKKTFYTAAVIASVMLFSCNGNSGAGTSTGTDSTGGTSSDSSGNTAVTDTGMMSGNSNASSTAVPPSSNTAPSNVTPTDTMNKTSLNSSKVTDADVIKFVKEASSGGMMEVQMGSLAAQNASSQRVKDFGAMMVTDHNSANGELKTLATSNGITVPMDIMPEHQKSLDMLKNLKGAAFDKAYVNMMVTDHKKDVAAYKKASTNLKEPAYKAFASRTIPTLQKHLDSIQAIHSSMK